MWFNVLTVTESDWQGSGEAGGHGHGVLNGAVSSRRLFWLSLEGLLGELCPVPLKSPRGHPSGLTFALPATGVPLICPYSTARGQDTSQWQGQGTWVGGEPGVHGGDCVARSQGRQVWVLTLRGEHFCKEEPVGGGAGPGAVQGDLGEAGRGHPLEGVRRAALSHYQLS